MQASILPMLLLRVSQLYVQYNFGYVWKDLQVHRKEQDKPKGGCFFVFLFFWWTSKKVLMARIRSSDGRPPCGHVTKFWALGNQPTFRAICIVLRSFSGICFRFLKNPLWMMGSLNNCSIRLTSMVFILWLPHLLNDHCKLHCITVNSGWSCDEPP